jgi:hypothetical protein
VSVNAFTVPMLSVYEGQRCVGFLLRRGRMGFEAFDAAERSCGIFIQLGDAANAVMSRIGSST